MVCQVSVYSLGKFIPKFQNPMPNPRKAGAFANCMTSRADHYRSLLIMRRIGCAAKPEGKATLARLVVLKLNHRSY